MITYEWLVETMDGEDIVNIFHCETFRKAQAYAAELRAEGLTVEVGLVRDRWNYDKT